MKRLKLSEIKNQLITMLKGYDSLPNRIFIIDQDTEIYGGAHRPVYGFDNVREGWELETIEDAIESIKLATKAQLVGKDLHYTMTEWRREEYRKVLFK